MDVLIKSLDNIMSRFTNTEKQFLLSVTTGDNFDNLVVDVKKEINSRKINNIQVIEDVIVPDTKAIENDPIAIVTAKVLQILAFTMLKMKIHRDFERYVANKIKADVPNIVCRVHRIKCEIEQENRIEKILTTIMTEIIESYNKQINFYNKKEIKLAKELSKRKLEDIRIESPNNNQIIEVLSKKQEKNLRRKERKRVTKVVPKEIVKVPESLTETICSMDWADDTISETVPVTNETKTVPYESVTIPVGSDIGPIEIETVVESDIVSTKPIFGPIESIITKKKPSYAQALRSDIEFPSHIENNILCKKFEITKIFAGTDSNFVPYEKATFLSKNNTTSNPWLQHIMKKIHKPLGYKIRFYVNDGKYESIIMVKESDHIVLLQHRKHNNSDSQIKLDERWIKITLL